MPIAFPHRDSETGQLTQVDYYSAEEVAGLVHVSRETVWRNCSNARWPHLKVQRRYFLNAAQIERVIEMMTVDPDELSPWEPPRSLGVIVGDDELGEGVR